MAGGRKKSSKLAAQSAAISAVGESVNGHGEEEKSIIQHPRTILGVLLISFLSYWFVANSNQTLPVSNFNTTELFNLSNYDINLSSSNEMLKTAYNEFYADTVQVSSKMHVEYIHVISLTMVHVFIFFSYNSTISNMIGYISYDLLT